MICQKNNCYRSTTLLSGLGWTVELPGGHSIVKNTGGGLAQ